MVFPSEKGTQTESRVLKTRESRHEDSIPALVVEGAMADEVVSRLERRMIAWTRGRVRNVHLSVVLSSVAMSSENLGQAAREFPLGVLKVKVRFFFWPEDEVCEVEPGRFVYREIFVLESPSLITIAFDLFLRFRFSMEIEDRNRAFRFRGLLGLFERFLQAKCLMAAGGPNQVEFGVWSFGEDVVQLVSEKYRGELGRVWTPVENCLQRPVGRRVQFY